MSMLMSDVTRSPGSYLSCELSTRESRDQLQSDHCKAQFILLRWTYAVAYAETHRPTPLPAQRPNVKWWFNVMIWYLLPAVMAIMLLQRAASSSALAIVLWVIQATCPWTLHASGPHVYCTLTWTTTQNYRPCPKWHPKPSQSSSESTLSWRNAALTVR